MPYGYITKLSDKLTREQFATTTDTESLLQPTFTTQKI